MTGWGADSAMTPFSPFMKEHSLNLESTAKCGTMLNDEHVTIDESFVCSAGNFGSAVCFGDSGGPLQLMNHQDVTNAHPIIIGVVNFGVPCGLGRPDAFARISHYKDWINQVLNDSRRRLIDNEDDNRMLSAAAAANIVNPWTSVSLDTFLEPVEISILREGQKFQCLGDDPSSSVYQYIYGERYELKQSSVVASSLTVVGCKFVPPIASLLSWSIDGKLWRIKKLFNDYPDIDVNARNEDLGITAIFTAAKCTHVKASRCVDVVEYLVNAGADLNVINNWGRTPLFLAFHGTF